jgi:hypothetical protein
VLTTLVSTYSFHKPGILPVQFINGSLKIIKLTSLNRIDWFIIVMETLCFLCIRKRVFKYRFQKGEADEQTFFIICTLLGDKTMIDVLLPVMRGPGRVSLFYSIKWFRTLFQLECGKLCCWLYKDNKRSTDIYTDYGFHPVVPPPLSLSLAHRL